jgi:tetratricopeptide (TPR) repeat protein
MPSSEYVKKYAITLVGLVALAAHYPVLSAPFFNLDDNSLITGLINSDTTYTFQSVVALFHPVSINRYFRPLLQLTFMADNRIWGQVASGYHLTNYLLHFLNSLLLYAISLKLFAGSVNRKPLACMTAMLFAVHPLTCEPVSWISGRTDVLAGFFSLAAFYFFLGTGWGSALSSIFCVLAGLFSKESALATIPLILTANIILRFRQGATPMAVLKSTLSWAVLFGIPLIVYLFLRMDGLEHLDSGVQEALSAGSAKGGSGSSLAMCRYVAAVIAFYIKKLFIPFPLNFAIYRINEALYDLLFVLLAVTGGCLLIRKRGYASLWLLMMVTAFSPAILVATSKMAWTPLAERYLYLSVAVWAVAMGMLYQYGVTLRPRLIPIARGAVLLLICVFFVASFHRDMQWTDNKRLWADTYQHSPQYGKVLYKYGEALGGDAGVPYFKEAVASVPDDQWKDYSLLALAEHAVSIKKYPEAKAYIKRALGIRATPENYYRSIAILMQMKGLSPPERDALSRKCIEYYNAAYAESKDPMALYAVGNLYLDLKEKANARYCFKEILNHFPLTAYARLARVRLDGLAKEHS